MGYFRRDEASDKELYDRVYNRYVQIYPEASEPDFEPNFSGHEEDWDILYEEESKRLQQEREAESENPPPKPPPKKKSKKKKGKSEPVENCSTTEDPNAKYCKYDDLLFTAGGGSEIQIADYSPQMQSVYEIVCGRTTEKGSLKIDIGGDLAGPCDAHKNKVFYAYGDCQSPKSKTDDAFEIEMFSSNVGKFDNPTLRDIFYDNIGLDHKPDKVKVGINRCGRKNELHFHIYPKYEYSLSGTLKYGDTKIQDSGVNVGLSDEDKKKKWSERSDKKISFTKSYDGEKINFGKKLEEAFDLSKVFAVVNGISNLGKDYFSDIFAFELTTPSITLSGKWNYRFDSKAYTVTRNGSLKISAEPLIGMKFSISVLKAGMTVAGGGVLITIPAKVKKWTGGKVDVDFDIRVFMAGSISASVEQAFQYNNGFNTSIASSLEVGLEIFIVGNVNLYVFHIGASIKGTASAKVSATFNLTKLFAPAGSLKTTFDGLIITLVRWCEAGILWWSEEYESTWTWQAVDARDLTTIPFDAN